MKRKVNFHVGHCLCGNDLLSQQERCRWRLYHAAQLRNLDATDCTQTTPSSVAQLVIGYTCHCATPYNQRGHSDLMITRVAIKSDGITSAATQDTPPQNGVLVSRKRKQFVVNIDADVSCEALTALLTTLRAINGPIELRTSTEQIQFQDRNLLCMHIVKRALNILEAQDDSPFSSQIELANAALLIDEETPESLINLCRFSTQGMDTPAALIALNELAIENLCVIGLNRAMRYCFLKIPKGVT